MTALAFLRLPALASLVAGLLLAGPGAAQSQSAASLPTGGLPATGSAESVEAPTPALLVADSIVVTPDNVLIASGNVEILYESRRLRASEVIYNQEDDSLRLVGPLRSEDEDGNLILADAAEIDAGMRNGILRGARLVLDRQLQLAAVQMARVDGRYSVLSRATVSSCQVCEDGRAPLWEIRARRIVHDDVEKQIYLDGAQIRVLDVPIGYVPTLRLPDPSQTRLRGFLFPSVTSSNRLGTGVKLPYFIPIGPHRDLTLTPFGSEETSTLEYRYRQAFVRGDITVDGAVSRDTLLPGSTRGYLFMDGRFEVFREVDLRFGVELTSDPSYLRSYNYSGKSRLESDVSLSYVKRNRLTQAAFTHYESLREDENDSTLPSAVLDGTHLRRMFPYFGGEVRFAGEVHGHYRESNTDVVGRDVYRASTTASWRQDWLLSFGAQADFQVGVALDAVRNLEDSTSAGGDASAAPFVAASLRYPLVATDGAGTRYTLEPLAQISWTGGTTLETANDESTRSEFDEGNLLDLSRFATNDRRERGGAMALGLQWGMSIPDGWRTNLTLGRILRAEIQTDFSPSSGLASRNSDWLVATQVGHANGLDLIARAMIDANNGEINRGEARGRWTNATIDLSAAYLLLPKDAVEERSNRISEWSFDGSYRLSRHWTTNGSWQYDIAQDRTASGTFGLEYQNECVITRFETDWDFAESDDLDPTITYGLTVELTGFATSGAAGGYRRQCSD